MNDFGFNGNVNNYNSGLTYLGAWDALYNIPNLTSGVGTSGGYYIVSIAGTTNLDGITDWQVGDWAIFEGATNMWQKIDNHDIQAYTTVQNESLNLPQRSIIDFQGAGVVASDNGVKTIVTIPNPNLQSVVNVGNGISNFGGLANASIQSTNFVNNRTLYLNNDSNPTIKLEDNLNGTHYTTIDIDTLNLSGNSYNWLDIVQSYSTIQEEGVNLPQQNIIDFQGAGVTATNGSGKTIITIPSPTTYGLYSQIANSVPVAATIIEGTLIGSGLGVLIVPANGFSQGDSFRADLGGILSSKNSDTLRVRVKAGSIVLGDSGVQTMPASTNDVWQLSLNFTIRATGVAGVANIVTLGEFHYTKTSNGTQEGFAFNTINSTTFDTTISNTLDVTAQWSSNSALNSIYSDIFILNKIY